MTLPGRTAAAGLVGLVAAAGCWADGAPARGQSAPQLPFGKLEPATAALVAPHDLAFGAFQRGYFGTALQEATKRISDNPQDGAAMTLIGEIYAQGLAVKQDSEEAAHWYKLASQQGNREGTFAYGMALLNGTGIAKDPGAAKALFEAAAREGHAGALYNLGIMALQPATGRDYDAAFDAFSKASAAGDLDATFALATMLRAGQGTMRNEARAAALFKQAGDQKHPGAELEYAIMAFNGDGIQKDEAAAARYFQLAALQGNPVAANRLARLFAAGRGIDKNLLEAARWHILARAKGVSDEWLDSVVSQLSSADRAKVDSSLRKMLGR